MTNMKSRFRLIRRGTRGGTFYHIETRTGNRTSLQIADEDEARYAHIRRVAIPS